MKTIMNDGDPWSPVDASATIDWTPEAQPPLEVKGGNVTAHINLGAENEKPTEEELEAADKDAADDSDTKETAAEVEDAEAALEQKLAEKLAALDAAKSGKKTKR